MSSGASTLLVNEVEELVFEAEGLFYALSSKPKPTLYLLRSAMLLAPEFSDGWKIHSPLTFIFTSFFAARDRAQFLQRSTRARFYRQTHARDDTGRLRIRSHLLSNHEDRQNLNARASA